MLLITLGTKYFFLYFLSHEQKQVNPIALFAMNSNTLLIFSNEARFLSGTVEVSRKPVFTLYIVFGKPLCPYTAVCEYN
jgi:hypothetical protein